MDLAPEADPEALECECWTEMQSQCGVVEEQEECFKKHLCKLLMCSMGASIGPIGNTLLNDEAFDQIAKSCVLVLMCSGIKPRNRGS